MPSAYKSDLKLASSYLQFMIVSLLLFIRVEAQSSYSNYGSKYELRYNVLHLAGKHASLHQQSIYMQAGTVSLIMELLLGPFNGRFAMKIALCILFPIVEQQHLPMLTRVYEVTYANLRRNLTYTSCLFLHISTASKT